MVAAFFVLDHVQTVHNIQHLNVCVKCLFQKSVFLINICSNCSYEALALNLRGEGEKWGGIIFCWPPKCLTNDLFLSTFVLIMSTLRKRSIADALFPKSAQAVLSALFSGTNGEVHLRGIEQATGQSPGTLQRVLDRFEGAGLVIRTKRGNQVFYRADRSASVYSDLVNIVVKTIGLAEPIRRALQPLKENISVAFIYGSVARGDDSAKSDVDVMIVGEVSLQEIVEALAGLQRKIGREINPINYSPSEYSQRLNSQSHFTSSLKDEPKIFLIGGQDELDRLG